jgi:hypothetical protein
MCRRSGKGAGRRHSSLAEDPARRNLQSLKNISLSPCLKGAFGVSFEELCDLFSVLSYGREDPDLDITEHDLPFKLGEFYPLMTTSDDAPPDAMYSFPLVLHHIATRLNLDSTNINSPVSPILLRISEISRSMLEDSSLHRGRALVVESPSEILKSLSLATLVKKEESLWTLLLFLGAVKVSRYDHHNSRWILKIASPFAQNDVRLRRLCITSDINCTFLKLFSTFPPIQRAHLYENPRDVQLRALFERNPTPVAEALAQRLSAMSLLNLYDMSEAVLQATFNGYMDGEDKLFKDNYFEQLRLLIDSTKDKKVTAVSTTVNQATAGLGRNGFLDAFMCRFTRFLRTKNRVVAIELKHLNLRGFFRAVHVDDEACEKAVKGTKDDFWVNCRRKR